MASYPAIAATTKAIVSLLGDAYQVDEDIKKDVPEAKFVGFMATDFTKPVPVIPKNGMSLYLYRALVNTSRRNLQPRTDFITGERFKPSLPLDLFYLLTPWGESVDLLQNLLAWTMRTLNDYSTLNANLINSYWLLNSHIFGSNEAIELVCDTMPVTDLNAVVEPFKPKAQLSVPYVARMVLIDSTIAMNEYAPVQVRAFDIKQVES